MARRCDQPLDCWSRSPPPPSRRTAGSTLFRQARRRVRRLSGRTAGGRAAPLWQAGEPPGECRKNRSDCRGSPAPRWNASYGLRRTFRRCFGGGARWEPVVGRFRARCLVPPQDLTTVTGVLILGRFPGHKKAQTRPQQPPSVWIAPPSVSPASWRELRRTLTWPAPSWLAGGVLWLGPPWA